ncbi:MAG: TIGR03792 family protein [Lacipirellulaceae bacterium]
MKAEKKRSRAPIRRSWLRVAFATVGLALVCCFGALTAQSEESVPPIAVEELTFSIDASAVDAFLRLDDKIWTPHLAERPGYLGKESWVADKPSDDGSREVKLVIRWRSLADWHAAPKQGLDETDERFAAAMKPHGAYKMTAGRAYSLARTASAAPTVEAPTVRLAELWADPAWRKRARDVFVPRDPTFGADKRYRAVPLKDVLFERFALEGLDPQQTTLVLTCVDGYQPTMTLAKAQAYDGWLAFEDPDVERTTEGGPGNEWVAVQPGGKRVPIAPCYLVWPDAPRDDPKIAWPYALAELALVGEDPLRKAAAPMDPAFEPGFAAFATHCAKCHRANGAGGDLGPELAAPRAVTEYWRRDELVKFIQNPAAYRAGCRMPPMPHLDAATIESVLGYLEHLAVVSRQ